MPEAVAGLLMVGGEAELNEELRGFGVPVEKSLRLSPESMEPSAARKMALVVEAAGAGAEPS